MPKMTKAQAKKRLLEARDKIGRVVLSGHMSMNNGAKLMGALSAEAKKIDRK